MLWCNYYFCEILQQKIIIAFLQIADSKSLYESSYGKKFALEHCWHILGRHPKWFDEVSKQKAPQRGKGLHSSLDVSSPITPSTLGTPTDLATDDLPNLGFVQRPPTWNVEKQKQRATEEKEIPSPVMANLIKEMVEGKNKAEFIRPNMNPNINPNFSNQSFET